MSNSMSTTLKQKKTSARWVMLGFICLFTFLITGFTNQTFNVLLRTIAVDFGWTNTQITTVNTAMASGMIWFVFVAGAMMDRISVKKMLVSVVILLGVLTFLRGEAQGFVFFFSIMFSFGVASAFFAPATVKAIGLWFDAEELMMANGWLQASAALGMVVANLLAQRILELFGGNWRGLFATIGMGLIAIALLFILVGKDRKSEEASLTSNVLTKDDLGFWKNIKGVMKLPLVWVFTMANVFFLGVLSTAIGWGQFVFQSDPGWGVSPYATYGLSIARSGQISATGNGFAMVAMVLVPLLFKKIGRKHLPVVAIGAGIVSAIVSFIGLISYNFTLLIVVMMITGILCGVCIPAPRLLMLSLPEVSGARAGTAMGFFLTVERLSVTLLMALLGGLMAGGQVSKSVLLGMFYLLQLGSPLLLLWGMILLRKKKAKNT